VQHKIRFTQRNRLLEYNVITVTCYDEGDGKNKILCESFFCVHDVKKMTVPIIFVTLMNSLS
jgi:hypothetical protein